jgi:hypothetical protein
VSQLVECVLGCARAVLAMIRGDCDRAAMSTYRSGTRDYVSVCMDMHMLLMSTRRVACPQSRRTRDAADRDAELHQLALLA